MKIAVLTFALMLSSIGFASEQSTSDAIIGHWQYVGHIYEGQVQDPINPDLILTFQFNDDGSDRLHWERKNEPGFCERHGQYEYSGEILIDQVTWVNPNNSFECGKDPDMRLGNKTQTRLIYNEGKLYMDLPLGDKTLTYIWQKIEESKQPILILLQHQRPAYD